MRLIPLHNALLAMSTLLEAKAAAIKILPRPGAAWMPVDVAVGETYELQRMGWRAGHDAPELEAGTEVSVFGIQNVQMFSTQEGCVAWRVDVTDDLLNAMPGQFKFSEKRGTKQDSLGSLWIGLVAEDTSQLLQMDTSNGNSVAELLLGVATQTLWELYQSAQTHSDPISGLPGVTEFRSRLQRVLRGSNAAGKGVALLLIGIEDFVPRRHQFGQAYADRLVNLVTPLLESAIRADDGLYGFEEAHFAVVAYVEDKAACKRVADKLLSAFNQLTDMAEYEGIRAGIGYVYHDQASPNEDVDMQAICMGAEQALDSALSVEGSQITSFDGIFNVDTYSSARSLRSLLTDPLRQHLNNDLLWRTVSLIAAESEPEILCRAFIELLETSLNTRNVLLISAHEESPHVLYDPSSSIVDLLDSDQRRFVDRTVHLGSTQIQANVDTQTYWLLTPMISRSKVYGWLFLDSTSALDAADQVFLKALADQVAAALGSAQLARLEIDRSREESQALRAQLNDLQQTIQQPKVVQVATSAAMRGVLDFAYKIAPTDVSVLIMGESGVGKEVMARSIHEQSNRKNAPLVTVDCGAITHSLIDSELFGRVKGAFTGADLASKGRVSQAQGGTLFLDEIGELPLDVQSKLLRFVQEKEVTAVGGVTPEIIDARIICATNRDLAVEVEAGRFRADLYYRLQVIQVVVPPLRERAEDLPQLVQNILNKFTTEYDRQIDGLSEAAWEKVRSHAWPGNVRELQNTLLRATLACDSATIESHDVQLSGKVPAPVTDEKSAGPPSKPSLVDFITRRQHTSRLTDGDDQDSWLILAGLLEEQVRLLCLDRMPGAPIGRWLNDTLVLTAFEFAGQVVREGSRILGIPETTLRRQVAKAQQNASNPLHITSAAWLEGLPALNDVLRALMPDLPDAANPEDLADRVEAALLREVANATGDDHIRGAAFMGVTPPTYARRLAKHKISSNDTSDSASESTSEMKDQRTLSAASK